MSAECQSAKASPESCSLAPRFHPSMIETFVSYCTQTSADHSQWCKVLLSRERYCCRCFAHIERRVYEPSVRAPHLNTYAQCPELVIALNLSLLPRHCGAPCQRLTSGADRTEGPCSLTFGLKYHSKAKRHGKRTNAKPGTCYLLSWHCG